MSYVFIHIDQQAAMFSIRESYTEFFSRKSSFINPQ